MAYIINSISNGILEFSRETEFIDWIYISIYLYIFRTMVQRVQQSPSTSNNPVIVKFRRLHVSDGLR